MGKKVREREHRRNGREGDTLAGSAAAAEARDPAAAAARKGAESCCAMGGASSRARVLTAPRRERERARLSFRGGGGGGGGEGEGGGEASDSSRLLFIKGKCCTVEYSLYPFKKRSYEFSCLILIVCYI